jgi:AcrR family transcriptional regulator
MPHPGWRKLHRIEARHGPIRGAVARLYGEFGTLKAVSEKLGVSRITLYRYLGKEEIAMLKAQAALQRYAEQREISVSV